MLSFGTRKTHVEELSEYELLEEEAFALLESILDDKRMTPNNIDTQHEEVEEEFFALLDEDEISDCREEKELRELEKEEFVFLNMTFQDDEAVDPDNSVYQHQPFDPLEMEKLEDEAFALLETIFEDDDEPIDEGILFKSLFINPQLQNLEEFSYSLS